MKRITLIGSGVAACACAVAAIGPVVASAPVVGPGRAPLTIVYDTTPTTHQLVFPSNGHGLTPKRGALRQDPAGSGMFAPGDNRPFRISKVNGASLQAMSPSTMAATLQRQITLGTYGAGAHLVAVDELLETFGDPAPANPQRNSPLTRINPNSPGSRFTAAMRILAGSQSPWGGTWASRVEVYIPPGIVSSIAVGRGPNHNLGRDGKPHYRTWRAVMPGLALAGGLHLEMYHGTGTPLTAFSASLWRTAPTAFLDLLGRYHGSQSTVHIVFSATTRPAGAPSGWGDAMATSWSLARSTAAGRVILRNGPDEYRIGGQAAEWMKQFNRQFPG